MGAVHNVKCHDIWLACRVYLLGVPSGCHTDMRLTQAYGTELIFVGDVSDDFPVAIGLLAENVHSRLFRNRRVG